MGSDKSISELISVKIKKVDEKEYNLPLKMIIEEDPRTLFGDEIDNFMGRYRNATPVVGKAYGLMGFIKFLKGYYVVLIT